MLRTVKILIGIVGYLALSIVVNCTSATPADCKKEPCELSTQEYRSDASGEQATDAANDHDKPQLEKVTLPETETNEKEETNQKEEVDKEEGNREASVTCPVYCQNNEDCRPCNANQQQCVFIGTTGLCIAGGSCPLDCQQDADCVGCMQGFQYCVPKPGGTGNYCGIPQTCSSSCTTDEDCKPCIGRPRCDVYQGTSVRVCQP